MIEPHYTKTYRISSPPANYTPRGRTVSNQIEEALGDLICREMDGGYSSEAIMGLVIDVMSATTTSHKIRHFHNYYTKKKGDAESSDWNTVEPELEYQVAKDIDPFEEVGSTWEAEHYDPPF